MTLVDTSRGVEWRLDLSEAAATLEAAATAAEAAIVIGRLTFVAILMFREGELWPQPDQMAAERNVSRQNRCECWPKRRLS